MVGDELVSSSSLVTHNSLLPPASMVSNSLWVTTRGCSPYRYSDGLYSCPPVATMTTPCSSATGSVRPFPEARVVRKLPT